MFCLVPFNFKSLDSVSHLCRADAFTERALLTHLALSVSPHPMSFGKTPHLLELLAICDWSFLLFGDFDGQESRWEETPDSSSGSLVSHGGSGSRKRGISYVGTWDFLLAGTTLWGLTVMLTDSLESAGEMGFSILQLKKEILLWSSLLFQSNSANTQTSLGKVPCLFWWTGAWADSSEHRLRDIIYFQMMEIIMCDIRDLELKTQNDYILSMKETLTFRSFAGTTLFLYSLYLVFHLRYFCLFAFSNQVFLFSSRVSEVHKHVQSLFTWTG